MTATFTLSRSGSCAMWDLGTCPHVWYSSVNSHWENSLAWPGGSASSHTPKGWGFHPSWGASGRQPINVSLSLSLPLLPKKLYPRKHTPRHIIITLPKIKDQERILEAAREKETVTYKGVPIRLSADFSKETLQARQEGLARSIPSHERQGPPSKITLSSKAFI